MILRWNLLWPWYHCRWRRLIQTMILSIGGPRSTGHLVTRCRTHRCSRTVWRHNPILSRRFGRGGGGGGGLLWRQTSTHVLEAIPAVVHTGAQHSGTQTLPLHLDSLVCHFTTHGSWSGWELRNPLACWTMMPAPGSGPCSGYSPSTRRASCTVTHDS